MNHVLRGSASSVNGDSLIKLMGNGEFGPLQNPTPENSKNMNK